MEVKGEDPKEFITRLEGLCFSRALSDGSPSEKADIVRNILVHQFAARASGLITDNGLAQLQSQNTDKYTSLVDNFDQKQGLNNFAEGALAICNLHRNESQAWKSSLTADRFLVSLHGQKLKESCQVSADQFMPPGKEQETVKLRPRDRITEKHSCINGSPHSSPGLVLVEDKVETNEKFPVALPGYAGEQKTFSLKGSSSVKNSLNPDTCNVKIPTESNSNGPNPWLNGPSNKNTFKLSLFDQRDTDGGSECREHEPRSINSGQKGVSFFQKGFGSDNQKTGNSKPLFSNQSHNFPPDGSTLNSGNNFSSGFQSNRYQGNQPGNYGDQEVPRKPLFASTGGGMSGSGYGCFNPQQASTRGPFDRRGETGKRPYNNNVEEEDGENESPYMGPFKTAKEQMSINQQKKYGQNRGPVKPAAYGNVKKSLGTRRGPSSKFVPPVMNRDDEPGDSNLLLRKAGPNKAPPGGEEPVDERLKGLEPKMIELIMNEIMDHGPPIAWSDIAGLEFAKKTIKEIVVWPMLRPDIFTGLRGPPKGLLLFGPPGTGKTLIGKCIASQSKSTFFSISASSLTSKWVGEGEKMVRALFAVSRFHQPAVIFIDEIDSLLSQRTDGEHEASRRIKTEFLIQLDGATTESDERILVIGATNRPKEIDEAARRRFVKRLYIPLPEGPARRQIILNLLSAQSYHLAEEELENICVKTDGYSGSDMANLCREAALGPIRSIAFGEIEQITADQVRPISFQDFDDAILQVRASVSAKDLDLYIDWNKLFGCGGR